MSKDTKINSRVSIFTSKIWICIFCSAFAFFVSAPKISAQDEVAPPAPPRPPSARGNYQPTPEPPADSTVRGRVFYEDTGRAVRRSSVMLMSKNGDGREAAGLTDNEGNFEIKNVRAGTYYAFVNAPGVVSPLAFADITRSRLDTFDEAIEGFTAIVVNGVNDVEAQIPARRGGAIGGRVAYADGDAAIGVKVEILRKSNDKYVPVVSNFSSIFSFMTGGGNFQTDDRGVYRFSGLPAGEYIVKVTESASHGANKLQTYNPIEETMFGGSSLLTVFYPQAADSGKAEVISLALGQEQTDVNITIPVRELFRVEGKVVAERDKSPVKGAKIYLKKKGDNTVSIFEDFGRRRHGTSSGEDGNWNFKELPNGNYTLVVEPPDPIYDTAVEGLETMVAAAAKPRPNETPKPNFAKKVLEIAIEDKNVSGVTIALGYGATISGTITTENNQEMPSGVTVSLINENEETASSASVYNGVEMTDAGTEIKPRKTKNDFRLESVAEGKTQIYVSVEGDDFYVKSATRDGADLLAKPLEIKEGENLSGVRIVLSKSVGTLKGKVFNDKKEPFKNASFSLVPMDAAKRRNPTFFRAGKTDENGEFETKAAPGEYAIVFYGKDFKPQTGAQLDKWLEEIVKDAPKAVIKANETEKITIVRQSE